MKRLLVLMILGCFLTMSIGIAAPSVIGKSLYPTLQAADSDEYIHILVLMTPEQNGQDIQAYVQGVRATERAAVVWDYVSAIAEDAQDDLLDRLYEAELAGDAHSIRSLVIGNAIDVEAKPYLVREIAARADVRNIEMLVQEQVLPADPGPSEPVGNELDEIDWGVNQVNAPDVWNMGYTGEGVVVAVMDTGVNYNHLDLADHMWDGGVPYPNHGWDFAYGDNNPSDGYGHGSHVAGSVASDGTAGSQCGVAPDAQIMVLKVLNDFGSGDYADVWAALDFLVENGADVATMSLGWHNVPAVSRSTFRTHYEVLAASNIVSVNSAGNDGNNMGSYPPPDNVKTPASVPPPWIHPDQPANGATACQITIGSTNTNDIISSYSSRGPCSWENESPWFDWVYAGGQQPGVIKPDLCAPGEDIKSCLNNNNSGYTLKSGTSMATPLTAGVCALLKSVDLVLSPAQIDEIMETTALELGTPGKDNTYGSGRVDAHAAVLAAGAYLTDIQVRLMPLYDPYYVPSQGGTIVFDAVISNNYAVNTPGQVRTLAILPNGNPYPLNTYNVTFQPGVNIAVNGVTEMVPGMAPGGTYTYVAQAGPTPWTMIDEDSFNFVKFGLDTDGMDAGIVESGWFVESCNDGGDAVVVVPSAYAVATAYPNPFNPTTTVSVRLPETANLTLNVYNVTGQLVTTLADGQVNAGQHFFVFDGANLSSGVYFVHANVPGELSQIQKVMLMK
jgi:subtilisin family serine protease